MLRFLRSSDVTINDTKFNEGDFIEFDREDGVIEITNSSTDGLRYYCIWWRKIYEPIVAQGPFVMNTQQEIAEAYNDFHSGKYGKITYAK